MVRRDGAPPPQSSLHLLILTAVTTWAKHKLLPSTSLGGSKDFGESCCPSAQFYGRRDLIPEKRTGESIPELLLQVPIHLAHLAGSDHPPANTTHSSVGQQGCGEDWGHRAALVELAFLWGDETKSIVTNWSVPRTKQRGAKKSRPSRGASFEGHVTKAAGCLSNTHSPLRPFNITPALVVPPWPQL